MENNKIKKETIAFIYYDISKKIFNKKGGREKAFKLCKVAAELGNLKAIYGVAKKYNVGLGVEKDEKKVKKFFIILP